MCLLKREKSNMSLFKKLFTRVMHHQVSKLDELYQRHAGQECYIFGDGISLKWDIPYSRIAKGIDQNCVISVVSG